MSITTFDNLLRQGLGLISPIASNYSVYRVGLDVNATSIITPGNLLVSNWPMVFNMGVPKSVIEQEEIYKMILIGIGDTRQFKVGDVFVETGPPLEDAPDGRVFTFVDMQPLKPAIFCRTEIMSTITRPNSASQEDEPVLGLVTYQGTSKVNEWYLTLQNIGGVSQYVFAPTGTAATVPLGLQPHTRLGSPQEAKFPTATRRAMIYGYAPLLPGVELLPGDYFTGINGERVTIENVQAFTSGLQGELIISESVFI